MSPPHITLTLEGASRFSHPQLAKRRSVIQGAELSQDFGESSYHQAGKDIENAELKKRMFEMQNEVKKLKQQLAEKTVEEFNNEKEAETNEDVEDQPEIIDLEEEIVTSVEWLKGYNVSNSENPGKLVINSTAKFTYNKTCGDIIHFHYSCKKKSQVQSQGKSFEN